MCGAMNASAARYVSASAVRVGLTEAFWGKAEGGGWTRWRSQTPSLRPMLVRIAVPRTLLVASSPLLT
jgi:hypothetical protein